MVGWILLALFGLIVLAFFIPVRVCVEYVDEWRVTVRLFGVIPVWTFPSDKPSKDKPAPSPATTDASAGKSEKKPSAMDEVKALFREEGVGGILGFLGKLAALLKTTLASLARFITIRKLALCVRVGGEEADETAVRYGQISAALSASLTVLSALVRIKKPIVRVYPDFTRDRTEARMRMVLWMWPFGALGVLVAAACKFLALWIKTTKAPQSGVQNKKEINFK